MKKPAKSPAKSTAKPAKPEAERTRPFTIAISALGGQGGGVLADWIVGAAERSGFTVQATSVPGVAQRTGATIYYLELFPAPARRSSNAEPVLALMPVPGDVDVVVASELMEAGRAILRGLVTPGRTTLVASTHRVFGISEKSAMGDGIADSAKVAAAARAQARSLVAFDMDAASREAGAAISAVMFGALAGSGVLPIARSAFEAAIEGSGMDPRANLAGFALGFERAVSEAAAAAPSSAPGEPRSAAAKRLTARIEAEFPAVVRQTLAHGAARLLDYQDEAYAGLYLDRLETVAALESIAGKPRASYVLTAETGRWLALWMAYEDIARVADLKTRKSRFERTRTEVRAEPGQIVKVVEFMHPRLEELCDMAPAPLGRAVLNSNALSKLTAPLFRNGRHVRTTGLGGFLTLSLIAGMRSWRRGSLRYEVEQARILAWLADICETAAVDYDLAVELAACARLIKGYGDTHARGLGNFKRIMAARRTAGRIGASDLAGLIRAALADEQGRALDAAIAAIETPTPMAAE
jgi:indolepyruvate ferredoxin oxidoreductase beta subunit